MTTVTSQLVGNGGITPSPDIEIIETDQPKFISFAYEEGQPSCLTTVDLKGNSVALIVSDKGVIMTEISHKNQEQRPSDISFANATARMTEMAELYCEKKDFFGRQNHEWAVVLCGKFAWGVDVDTSVKKAITSCFESWWNAIDGEFPVKQVAYELRFSYDSPNTKGGMVFVDGRGAKPFVWVNYELITDPYFHLRG